MDSRARDEVVERLLRSPGMAGPSTADVCPEPDVIASWADGRLEGAERARCEVHIAACGRCTEMVAAFVRTADFEAPAAGEVGALSWRWLVRWAMPVAGVAAAFAVWILVQPPPPNPAPAEQARAASRLEAGRVGEEAPSVAADMPGPGTGAAEPSPPTAPPAPTLRKEEADAPARTAPPLSAEALPPAAGAGLQARDAPSADAAAPSGVGASVPSAPATGESAAASQAAGRLKAAPTSDVAAEDRERRESQVAEYAPEPQPQAGPAPAARAGAPAPPAAPPAPAAPRADAPAVADNAMTLRKAVREATGEELVFTVEGGGLQCRVSGGVLRVSRDRGASWERATLQPGGRVLAGVAVAPATCWIVGERGRVLVTADGRRWRSVPLAEPVDAIAVVATDATSAEVTTRDGARYVTHDGGMTWIRK